MLHRRWVFVCALVCCNLLSLYVGVSSAVSLLVIMNGCWSFEPFCCRVVSCNLDMDEVCCSVVGFMGWVR